MLVSYRDLRSTIGSHIESYKNDSDKIAELFAFRARLEGYDLNNLVAIKLQKPDTLCVDSASEWEKSGYRIKPGEEGIKVLAPVTEKVIVRSREESPVKVRDLGDNEKRMVAVGQIKSEDRTTYVNSLVYDISQTDCPERDYKKFTQPTYGDIPQGELYDCMKNVVEQSGFNVKRGNIHSVGLESHYNPETRDITISSSLNDSRRLSALCNEYANGLMAATTTQPQSIAEFESAGLSIMMQSRMGLPVSAENQSRITSAHKRVKMGSFDLNESFTRTQKAFNHTVDKFEQQLAAMSPDRDIDKAMSMAAQQSVNENFIQGLRME